jgi:hypothetical protein
MSEVTRDFSRGSTHLIYYRYAIPCHAPPFFARVVAVRDGNVDVIIFHSDLARETDTKYYVPREDAIVFRARICSLKSEHPIICVVGAEIVLDYGGQWNGEPVPAR